VCRNARQLAGNTNTDATEFRHAITPRYEMTPWWIGRETQQFWDFGTLEQ
jgi:hypothetical protein